MQLKLYIIYFISEKSLASNSNLSNIRSASLINTQSKKNSKIRKLNKFEIGTKQNKKKCYL